MPTVLRYWLAQIPGALVAALILSWMAAQGWIDRPWVLWGIVAWVAKDAALYPLTRSAYERQPAHLEPPVGAVVTVRQPLAPGGTISIGGTIWQARLAGGGRIEPGTAVRVVERRGLQLIVAPASGASETKSERSAAE